MIAMTYLPLIVYAAGIVCLLGELAMPYRPRHRAIAAGLSTLERADEAAVVRLVESRRDEPTTPMEQVRAEIFGDEAPLCPPMYSPIGDYQHKAGVGRYAHLRTDELDTTNDRILRRRGLGPAPEVDLQALRVRAALPTVGEVDDEWASEILAGAR